ncbi:hypothetical protein H8D57_03475 [bacterium]|nr:hypothetical protein [bacterium]
MTSLTIVIDTREQLPFSFNTEIDVIRKSLLTGDYSLLEYENQVAVERKDINDFVQSVIHQRERFLREMIRLSEMPFRCVVVEASWSDILRHHYRSGADPRSVVGSALSIIVDYGVPVYFCSDRQLALAFTEKYLKRVHRKLTLESKKEK